MTENEKSARLFKPYKVTYFSKNLSFFHMHTNILIIQFKDFFIYPRTHSCAHINQTFAVVACLIMTNN